MKTVVGLFDNFSEAQSVVQDLVNSGFRRDDISMVANNASGQYGDDFQEVNLEEPSDVHDGGGSGFVRSTDGAAGVTAESAATGAKAGTVLGGTLGLLVGLGALAIPGVGPVIAAGPLAAALGSTALGAGLGAAAGAATGGLVGALNSVGVPEGDAGLYAEGVRRGGILVSVASDEGMVDQAVAILDRHNAIDIDQRGASYRESGYTGYNATAPAYTADEIASERSRYATAATNTTMTNPGSTTIPVVEEQLEVGKRQVQSGGARVHTRVIETPVQEQVTLHEEHVTVDRHPVNRAVDATDADAFRERTIEMTETAEVPVVAKQARVVEEVTIGKQATERTETVSDTVRRTDVQVDELNDTETIDGGTTTSTTTPNTRSNY